MESALRRAARTDANHTAIVQALRAAGCSVLSLAAVGKGAPDLLVGRGSKNTLLEVKDGNKSASRKRLTELEAEFAATWRGQVATVETIEEALAAVSVS